MPDQIGFFKYITDAITGFLFTVDETALLSSKAPKASPSFTVGIGIGGVAAGAGGVAFPAAAVAVVDVNNLDDYEEGTFTIGVSFGGGTTGITYNASFVTGQYTKVGNLVTVGGYVILTNKGSSVGAAAITGLPFTSGSIYTGATIMPNAITFSGTIGGLVNAGGKIISLYECTLAGVRTTITDVDFANSSEIWFSCSYFAA